MLIMVAGAGCNINKLNFIVLEQLLYAAVGFAAEALLCHSGSFRNYIANGNNLELILLIFNLA